MNRQGPTRLPASPFARLLPFWSLALLVAAPIGAQAADANRAIPEQGLAAYAEYDGLGAHAAAWEATAACAVLERTPAGALTLEIARQVLDRKYRSLPAGSRPAARDILAFQEHVIRHGFAAGLYLADGPTGVVVLKGLGSPPARAWCERLLSLAEGQDERPAEFDRDFPRLKGRKVYLLRSLGPNARIIGSSLATTALVCWFEGDDLVGVAGSNGWTLIPPDGEATAMARRVAAVLDTIEKKVPGAATHPSRARALAEGRQIRDSVPCGLFFVEAEPIRYWRSAIKARATIEALPAVEVLPLPPPSPSPSPSPSPMSIFGPGKAGYLPPAESFLVPRVLTALEKAGMAPDATKTVPAKPEGPAASDPALPPALELPPQPAAEPPADVDKEIAKAVLSPAPAIGPAAGPKPRRTMAQLLGLDGIVRVVGCWGFQGKALLTDVRIEAPAPRQGLLGLLDQPGFSTGRLPAIHADTGALLVGSLDAGRAYDALLPIALEVFDRTFGHTEPTDQGRRIKNLERSVREATGVRLREDLLGHLDSTWALSSLPIEPAGETWWNMPILRVGVDDTEAVGRVLDTLARHVNAYFASLGGIDEPGLDPKPAVGLPLLALEPLPAPARGYRLTSPSRLTFWLGEGNEPTLILGDSFVVVADTPRRARAAFDATLQGARTWTPAGEVARAIANMPASLTLVSIGDPRGSTWPAGFVNLPKWVQSVSAMKHAFPEHGRKQALSRSVGDLLGIPESGGMVLSLRPERIPKADSIRAELFPSVLAIVGDDSGLRMIAREALPFGCAQAQYGYRNDMKSGETHALTLHPFLFPAVQVALGYHPKSPSIQLYFGLKTRK